MRYSTASGLQKLHRVGIQLNNVTSIQSTETHMSVIMSTTTTATSAATPAAPSLSSALDTAKRQDGKTNRLHRIPRPESALDQRRWQLEHMAGAFRIFAKLGFADGASGHISLRGSLQLGASYGTVTGRLIIQDRPGPPRHVLDQPLRRSLWPAKGVAHGPRRRGGQSHRRRRQARQHGRLRDPLVPPQAAARHQRSMPHAQSVRPGVEHLWQGA